MGFVEFRPEVTIPDSRLDPRKRIRWQSYDRHIIIDPLAKSSENLMIIRWNFRGVLAFNIYKNMNSSLEVLAGGVI